MDLCLYGLGKGVPIAEIARACGLTPEQVQGVWQFIDGRRRATQYLHEPALLVESVLPR